MLSCSGFLVSVNNALINNNINTVYHKTVIMLVL